MQQIVESIAVQLGLDAKQYTKGVDDVKKKGKELDSSVKETDKNFAGMAKAVAGAAKALGGLFAAFSAATGLDKLVNDVAKANDELNILNKQLGMSTQSIKAWQGVAAASGGSAAGMTSSMKSLNKQMNDFVVKGDTGLLPYMNALGVSMVDTNGKLRKTDAVMLDLADSFSKMDKQQAYALGQDMGLDEGTITTLIQGKDAMKEMIAYQKTMYQSSEKDLENSRELRKNQALINQQWGSLKTMMANSIIPIFVKLSAVVLKFFEFMQKHRRTVTIIFQAIAFTLTAMVIPALHAGLIAALAFIAPFAPFILVVTALGAAFALLYDDYKTWAEGGKSLFNWGAFTDYINSSKTSVDGLTSAFSNMAKELASGAIPTLKEYWQILKKLFSGDFKEAGKQTVEMAKEAGHRVGNAIDTITGHEQGTAAKITIINRGGGTSKNTGNASEFNKQLEKVADKYGITNRQERASFFANVAHETGDGRKLSESTKYSYAGWKKIAPNQSNVRRWMASHNKADFDRLSDKDKMNIMYNNMLGNRAGEGYKFRGRGGIQLTGRTNYQAFATYMKRPDIMQNPDIVANDPAMAAEAAAWYWKVHNKKASQAAARGDYRRARQLVNGGNIGMEDYIKRYNKLMNNKNIAKSVGTTPHYRPNHANETAASNKTVTVNTGDIKVYTASNTVTGTTTDAMKAVDNYANQLGAVMT